MKKWADKSTEELKALRDNYMSLVFHVTTPTASQIREDVHEIEMELKRRQNFELAMQDAADEPLENLKAGAELFDRLTK